jgi:hypothetical protein
MAPTRYGPAAAHGAKTRRDLALHRVSKVTKRIAVATVASVGILGLYVSRSLPGHASTPATTAPSSQNPATATTPTTSPPTASSSGSSAPQTVPAAPVSPPTTTPRRVHVTTGAS